MDARVDGRVVTPRHGKPVEINALWHNALVILAGMEARLGDPDRAGPLESRAAAVRERFVDAFWNEEAGCLYDVLGDERPDPAIRPNQILALALPFPLLDNDRACKVLDVVEARLLTPVGLRTLEPGHPDYVGTYRGGVAQRDSAYHQGTVWPWLLGPFVSALVRYRGEDGRRQGRAMVDAFLNHLTEAGLGTISEVFDGDLPHRAGGAFAQAWSVAEILRAHVRLAEAGGE
jgi:predicted glycogen debranching enzyme